jgi:hypothetical protein
LPMTFLFFGFFGSNSGRSTGSDVKKIRPFSANSILLVGRPKKSY